MRDKQPSCIRAKTNDNLSKREQEPLTNVIAVQVCIKRRIVPALLSIAWVVMT